MNKKNIIIAGIIIVAFALICMLNLYTDSIDDEDDCLVISLCTGNMRSIESGVSVYCARYHMPLVLSDKTIPDQIMNWLPGYVKENNIKKIIIIGPFDASEIIKLESLGINIKQVNDNNIASILTKMARNNKDIKHDSVIFTASDPLAAHLGSYMNLPVFITANNSSYNSADHLADEYREYLKDYNIQSVVIVGSLPESLKDDIKRLNISIDEITGHDTLELSYNVNNKIKEMGYLNKSSSAYYGFYGEVASIIPIAYNKNAMVIEDSSNMAGASNYLKENNITDIYFSRNLKSDYILMEEEDYISDSIIKELQDNNFNIKTFTKQRTLDEATGLYDVRITSAQIMENINQNMQKYDKTPQKCDMPPLISMLNNNTTTWQDSNNITCNITQNNTTTYTMKWSTIHPYTFTKINDTYIHATTNTGYEYDWIYTGNNTYNCIYKLNNTQYHTTRWTQQDNKWIETQDNTTYTWYYNNETGWSCCDENNTIIYEIIKK